MTDVGAWRRTHKSVFVTLRGSAHLVEKRKQEEEFSLGGDQCGGGQC